MDTNYILDELEIMFPNAECELVHKNAYELAVAVALSAQTTDISVNKITPKLFKSYPTPYDLASADIKEIENHIKSIGLYRNKAKNIKGLAQCLIDLYGGEVPKEMDELILLPGVGRKTANVIMSVCFNIPAIAVDTHVERVSKRLGLAFKNDSVLVVEKKLQKKIKKDRWNKAHHLFIFFGRYKCTARNPKCDGCPFYDFCKYIKMIKKE
ncbi:MAG: endonuclease III [Erysipelotrichaceae bacterium]|nr:endonuclease III [Erysipelotrichaceae bacterium]